MPRSTFFFLGCHLIYFTSHSSFLKTPSLNYHQKAELCSHIVPFANFFMIIGNDIQCKLWPVYLISLLCHLCPVCHQVLLFLTSCFQIYLFYRFLSKCSGDGVTTGFLAPLLWSVLHTAVRIIFTSSLVLFSITERYYYGIKLIF